VALTIGQWAFAGTVATPVFTIPPGGCSVTFYSTAATGLYIGSGSALTSSNGYAVSTSPTCFQAFSSSKGAQLYGLNTAATTVPVNYIISSEA
jgi:hypothetical protein